jgi:hypothetical protein
MKNLKSLLLILNISLLLFTGCEKDETTVPPPVEIVIRGGANQKTAVGTQLSKPVLIAVQYADGTRISNARVSLTVNSGTVTPSEAKTSQEGSLEVAWVLGKTIGRQTMEIIVKDESEKKLASKKVNATAISDGPEGKYFGPAVFHIPARIGLPGGGNVEFFPNYVLMVLKTKDGKITGTASVIDNRILGPIPPGKIVKNLFVDYKVTGTITGKKVVIEDKASFRDVYITGTLSEDGKQIKGKFTRWYDSPTTDSANFTAVLVP